MIHFTDEELQNMTLEDAEIELANRLYAASALIELLEYKRNSKGGQRIRGNGHHIRQEIAKIGSDILRDRWVE